MSVDRIIEFNDSSGDGKFDERTDAILSYYGAFLPDANTIGHDSRANTTWHGDFMWRNIQSQEKYNEGANTTEGRVRHPSRIVLNVTTAEGDEGSPGIFSLLVTQDAKATTDLVVRCCVAIVVCTLISFCCSFTLHAPLNRISQHPAVHYK